MGLLDNFKSNRNGAIEESNKKRITNVESFNEKVLAREQKRIVQEQEKINQIRNQFNIYKGINCKVTFPTEEVVLKSHGGIARTAATLSFGVLGFVATSGVKQQKKKIVKDTTLQIVEKGVVFKKVTDDGKDLRIPYDNIISFTLFNEKIGRNNKYYELLLLENQSLIISLSKKLKGNKLEIIAQDLVDVINGRATGKDTEEDGWGLDYAKGKAPSEADDKKISSENISTTEELEKVIQMYEKGLLTDEEFASMKKKIIGN